VKEKFLLFTAARSLKISSVNVHKSTRKVSDLIKLLSNNLALLRIRFLFQSQRIRMFGMKPLQFIECDVSSGKEIFAKLVTKHVGKCSFILAIDRA
jgi:hypothetical protein